MQISECVNCKFLKEAVYLNRNNEYAKFKFCEFNNEDIKKIKELEHIFTVIATDMGDTCDGQARVIGVSSCTTIAKKIMNDDISYYLENNKRKEEDVERDSETFVIVGDESNGCKWQILETKFIRNAGV